ncbi:unnamed protein product [Linum tenue]|uniref:HMA domain-containing protein n=1 Tax=Linum tenue TaxID=586396 RepID=A0AAV0S507_9ROSI|nr:unnamed protein product [Linum tenue]
MARNTSSVAEEASTGLHCKTWLLRVSVHCQGCKRKVCKILLAIHGVYTVTVDMKQQRVTVTGNVEGETLIRKLSNKGKKASICDSNEPKNPKANQEQGESSQKKNKENQKQSENRGTKQEEEPKAVVIPAAAENSSPKTQTVAKDSPGNRVSGEKKRHEGSGGSRGWPPRAPAQPSPGSGTSIVLMSLSIYPFGTVLFYNKIVCN